MSTLGLSGGSKRNLTRGDSDPAKGAGGRKSKQEGEEDEAQLADVVAAMGRLVLQNTNKQRVLSAAIITTMVVPRSVKIVDLMKEAGAKYHKESTEKEMDMGPPHLWAWDAAVGWLKQVAEEEAWEDVKKVIAAHVKEVSGKDYGLTLAQAVRVCKVSRCFKETQSKLEFMITKDEDCKTAEMVWRALKKALVTKFKGQIKAGAAPSSGMERALLKMMRKKEMIKDKEDRHEW
eukprot:TRINITY_DN30486_c0_g1_i3.p2 TRINITY_DN30486_c0_g1~~TRINITY_DN30486_c0_g1_i3.p2  ORF type:complete len:233 (-),score=84.25 TRINITY_DN30486_c0_g1_i3:576-1274(-)